MEKREFRLVIFSPVVLLTKSNVILQAQICGLNIIVHAEELSAIVQGYERRGHFDEILQLLEAGLSLERAHVCAVVIVVIQLLTL